MTEGQERTMEKKYGGMRGKRAMVEGARASVERERTR